MAVTKKYVALKFEKAWFTHSYNFSSTKTTDDIFTEFYNNMLNSGVSENILFCIYKQRGEASREWISKKIIDKNMRLLNKK